MAVKTNRCEGTDMACKYITQQYITITKLYYHNVFTLHYHNVIILVQHNYIMIHYI